MTGDPGFRAAFTREAPRSKKGHALKDLAAGERLFANRCSYLIYSATFRALPETLKVRILDRLHAALLSRDPRDRHGYLPAEEKERIHGILVETHPTRASAGAGSAG